MLFWLFKFHFNNKSHTLGEYNDVNNFNMNLNRCIKGYLHENNFS